jgi:hypothetical protein
VAVAAGLVLPAVSKARAAASRSKDNLRTIGQEMASFSTTYGFFPGNGGSRLRPGHWTPLQNADVKPESWGF